MKLLQLFVISFAVFINCSNGLNTLAILPLSMKSHYAIGSSIVKSLLDVGHNVTAITMFKEDKPIDNYRAIYIPDTMNVSGKKNKFAFRIFNLEQKFIRNL